MRELFEQLRQEGEAGILRLIENRTQERVDLDFKTKTNPSHGKFDKEDKVNFGKGLSAFANSAGGLAVWGVDARKGPDDVDCAQPPAAPILGIEQFESEAHRLAGQLLMPRHDGIHIAHVKSSERDGTGYLLVYVERSERRPHRCEATGEKGYFKRAGESTFAMEHYDIEDAFRRTAAPSVGIERTEVFGEPIKNSEFLITALNIRLYLKNVSDVMAKNLYFKVGNCRNCMEGTYNVNATSPFRDKSDIDGWSALYGGSDFVLHPGDRGYVKDVLVFRYQSNNTSYLGDNRPRGRSAHFTAVAGCETARQTSFEYKIDLDNFERLRSASK